MREDAIEQPRSPKEEFNAELRELKHEYEHSVVALEIEIDTLSLEGQLNRQNELREAKEAMQKKIIGALARGWALHAGTSDWRVVASKDSTLVPGIQYRAEYELDPNDRYCLRLSWAETNPLKDPKTGIKQPREMWTLMLKTSRQAEDPHSYPFPEPYYLHFQTRKGSDLVTDVRPDVLSDQEKIWTLSRGIKAFVAKHPSE